MRGQFPRAVSLSAVDKVLGPAGRVTTGVLDLACAREGTVLRTHVYVDEVFVGQQTQYELMAFLRGEVRSYDGHNNLVRLTVPIYSDCFDAGVP